VGDGEAVLRGALAWALAGWAEADRCAYQSAALAAEFEQELAGRRDRAVGALDEHILLREALRQAEIARDKARDAAARPRWDTSTPELRYLHGIPEDTITFLLVLEQVRRRWTEENRYDDCSYNRWFAVERISDLARRHFGIGGTAPLGNNDAADGGDAAEVPSD